MKTKPTRSLEAPVQTRASMKHVRPNVVTEILDPVRLLEEEKPLAEPTRGVVQRVVDPAFTR